MGERERGIENQGDECTLKLILWEAYSKTIHENTLNIHIKFYRVPKNYGKLNMAEAKYWIDGKGLLKTYLIKTFLFINLFSFLSKH